MSARVLLIVAVAFCVACGGGEVPLATRPAQTVFLSDDGRLDLRGGPDATPQADRLRLGEGWSGAEPTGTWAVGLRATLTFVSRSSAARTLTFECHSAATEKPQTVRVTLNDVVQTELTLGRDMRRHAVELPHEALVVGANRVTFEFAYQRDPRPGTDPRRLAAFFSEVAFVDPNRGDRPATGRLFLPALPDEAAAVARTLAGVDIGSAAEWLSLGGDKASGCFVFDAVPRTAADRLPHMPYVDRARATVSKVGRARPDIFVLVLDAARPDHFGAYGYFRATTPNIDRLAADGLVFTNARAMTPTTLSSVPTMLTGLAVHDHGVVQSSAVLAEEAVTMAEALSAIGYRTICLTSNPNHSRAHGFDQGCTDFEELWRVRTGRRHDPLVVTGRAQALLAEHDERPVFMFAHYMPPHEPYRPEPQFDIFGDEGYSGRADGELETRMAIDRGERQPSAADMAQIVALYDGHLLGADAAVGELLDTLRDRTRWGQSVVIVTADHGEAFLDHGRMGHNTTLYDEMMRVPLIVRVPTASRPPRVDTESPATLEDLLPTVLARAGVDPAPAVAGFDLLGGRPAERVSHLRTNTFRPTRAVLAGRYKAIYPAGRGAAELYDLVRDPAERHDLALEEFDRLACLTAFVARETTRPPAVVPRAEDAALDDETLERLRSLGYTR